jgi:hypothetical protein
MIHVSLPPGVLSHSAPTSLAAAKHQRGHKVAEDRAKILAALKTCGPLCDEEIQTYCDMNQNAERPRRGSLVDDGLVMPGTFRRATRSGCAAGVWVLTDAGRQVAL